jgi:hypothetical protein
MNIFSKNIHKWADLIENNYKSNSSLEFLDVFTAKSMIKKFIAVSHYLYSSS